MSGGNIRNIVVAAAYAAAEDGAPISIGHLVRATQREYRKLGRMVVESSYTDESGKMKRSTQIFDRKR